jgi:hypothetical protein
MKAKLEAAGLEVTGRGVEVGQLFVRDPHGNMLEFIQPGGQLAGAPSQE